MRSCGFLIAFVLAVGCQSPAVPVNGEERSCAATETSPRSQTVTAAGAYCTPPELDGVHAEVNASSYAVIVTSVNSFTPGTSSDAYVDVLDSGKWLEHVRSTIFVRSMDAAAWAIDVQAQSPDGAIAISLSGSR